MALYTRAVQKLVEKANTVRPPVAPGRATLLSGVGTMATGTPVQYLQAYGTVGWLFSVVSRMCESTARVHWRLVDEKNDKEMEKHPAIDLWKRPNPFYSRYEFIETFQQHLDLVGEAYWIIVTNSRGEPRELWPVRPDRMRPIPHPTEYIAGYEYRVGAAVINLEPQDVIFLRRPNPVDAYRGMGPVQAILADLDAERFSAQWNRAFFLNSAEPGGIIEVPQEMDDADYERFVLRWREGHQGVGNAHRVAMLEAGMKWIERKFSQRDMQFQQLRMINRDIIMGAYGMPKSVLGIIDDVNRASYEGSMLMYADHVIIPRLERISLALNERLLPLMGADLLEWEYLDPTPKNREMSLAEATEGYEKGILMLNEARRRMGEPPVDDGDEFAPMPLALAADNARLPWRINTTAKLLPPSERERMRVSMEDLFANLLRREAEQLIDYLGATEERGIRVKINIEDVNTYPWAWWEVYGEETVKELTAAILSVLQAEAPGMSPTQAQVLAEQYAAERGAALLKLEGDASLVNLTRARVRELVAEAIREGETLKALAKKLREDYAFSGTRAAVIARTETATALGRGTLDAGLAQGKDQKAWFTQGDDLVTPECIGNAAQGWIPIRDAFSSGTDTVPQHPNCRCSIATRVTPLAESAVPLMVAEARCPTGHLLGKDVPAGGRLWCRKCKQEVTVG